MEPEIIISEAEHPEFEQFVHQGIKEFNNVHSPFHLEARKPGAITPLNIIVKDDEGNILGGLSASTYWGWLDIQDFFLPDSIRGKGLGGRILKMAEETALRRGCRYCQLTTYNFQARDFYLKRGYTIVGRLDDCPPGSSYYWMRKDFH